ncbi:hypothetical protein T484DRAFT_1911919, partial [Baffinella frigidus]
MDGYGAYRGSPAGAGSGAYGRTPGSAGHPAFDPTTGGGSAAGATWHGAQGGGQREHASAHAVQPAQGRINEADEVYRQRLAMQAGTPGHAGTHAVLASALAARAQQQAAAQRLQQQQQQRTNQLRAQQADDAKVDKTIPDATAALVPEAALFRQLVEYEQEIDAVVQKQLQEIKRLQQSKTAHPRLVRICVWNTHKNQPPPPAATPRSPGTPAATGTD